MALVQILKGPGVEIVEAHSNFLLSLLSSDTCAASEKRALNGNEVFPHSKVRNRDYFFRADPH